MLGLEPPLRDARTSVGSSDPSLEPEDWQQIWRRLKKLCLVTQRANSRLIFVTARPDDIFGDAVTFARYKNDI